MSRPDKRWSWRKALGESAGSTAGTVGAAIAAVLLVSAAPVMVPIAGIGAFAGAMLSKGAGHYLDDPWEASVRSSTLFGLAVGGAISSLLFFLALDHLAGPAGGVEVRFLAIGALAGSLEALLKSLIDDFRAAGAGRTEHERRF